MKPSTPWKAYGRYGTVGIELVLSIVLGYLGGQWLDGKLHTSWVWIVGAVLGTYAGFRSIFAVARSMQAEIEREEREERQLAREERDRLDRSRKTSKPPSSHRHD